MSTLKRTFLIVGVALFVMLDLILIINIGLAAANLDIASTGNSTSTLVLRASATADNAGSESSGQDTSSNSADTIEADSANQDSASQENADQDTSSSSSDNVQLATSLNSKQVSSVQTRTCGSVVASAHDDSIDIAIFNVAGTGSANVLRFEANRYLEADPLKGVIDKGSEGDVVGTYQCGSTQVIKAPRRSDEGHDYLYCKYYVEQNGKILAGPVYVTNVDASNAQITTPTQTKKGGANTHGMTTVKTPDIINDLDAKWTNVTVDLGSLLIKNENIDGSPVDQSIYDNTTTFTYEGVDYHFNNKRLNKYDEIIKKYTSYGINVQVILLCYRAGGDWKTYPQALSYVGEEGFPPTTFWSGESIGYNTSTQLGEKYFLATMEFFGQRYSQSAENGLVYNYVVGNEIDWGFAWQHIASWHYDEAGQVVYETLTLDTYMEEISRSMRLANLALKKYNSNITISISFTNLWAKASAETDGFTEYDYGYDSYAPKNQLDWLCVHEKARGDYDWGIVLHPYGADAFDSSDVLNDELEAVKERNYTSPDYKTSEHITISNIEIIETYLENNIARCNGQLRGVRLTEFSVSAAGDSQQEQNEQAGYLAWSFYRCALLPCIRSFEYWPVVNPKLAEGSKSRTGLLDTDGQTKRKAYDLWKYIDTNKSFEYASKYLPYLSYTKDGVKYCLDNGNITSYKDFLNIDSGNYDWDSVWNNWSITPMRADM